MEARGCGTGLLTEAEFEEFELCRCHVDRHVVELREKRVEFFSQSRLLSTCQSNPHSANKMASRMTTFARTLRAQPAAGAGRHSAAARRFASSSSSGAEKQLDWPTYLALRRSQRLYGLVASIPTTALGFSAGAGYFVSLLSLSLTEDRGS